jgi:Glycosyl transferase family 90
LQNKFTYYLKGFTRLLVPKYFFRAQLKKELEKISNYDSDYILFRVDYYNKLKNKSALPSSCQKLADFRYRKKMKTYFFDAFQYSRYFSDNLKANFLFGDITHIPEYPSIVKSRPIVGDNSNAVILKLNKIRHFNFVQDHIPFSNKKNLLIGRNKTYPPHKARLQFLKLYFTHPLCDIGAINEDCLLPACKKSWMSIPKQLEYKFILCLEGNDVATNLKWVMSSNSLAVMPAPNFETWFMEGQLIPDFHYVALKEDFSDLEEKLNYYIENPNKAEAIIQNAQQYVQQFQNQQQENLISLLVLDKYFKLTN